MAGIWALEHLLNHSTWSCPWWLIKFLENHTKIDKDFTKNMSNSGQFYFLTLVHSNCKFFFYNWLLFKSAEWMPCWRVTEWIISDHNFHWCFDPGRRWTRATLTDGRANTTLPLWHPPWFKSQVLSNHHFKLVERNDPKKLSKNY